MGGHRAGEIKARPRSAETRLRDVAGGGGFRRISGSGWGGEGPKSAKTGVLGENRPFLGVLAQPLKVLISSSSLSAIACTSAWVGGFETAQTSRSLNPQPSAVLLQRTGQPSTNLLNWLRISPASNGE
jgi:hypothetical protein